MSSSNKSTHHSHEESPDNDAHTRVPLRQVIYVEIDDEITNIFDRMKRNPESSLYLVIPAKAALLQSIVNLRILKQKAKDLERQIAIVTSDKTGVYFAQQCDIPVYDRLDEKRHTITDKEIPRTFETVTPDSPEMPNDRPTRLKEKKLSISDLTGPPHRAPFGVFWDKICKLLRRRKRDAAREPQRVLLLAPNRQALFMLVVISALLLLVIAYIALPGATIYITPDTQPLTMAANVTLADREKQAALLSDRSAHIIPAYRVKPPIIQRTFAFFSTGKIFKGDNARGFITIKNNRATPWTLVDKTRFQTDEGIVFRIQERVTIPAMRAGKPGEFTTAVIADERDAFGNVAGSRGNIGPSRFSLPGIQLKASKDLIYGESAKPMTGGRTETISLVTKEDLDAVTEKARKQILASAQDELQTYLIEYNRTHDSKLTLLTDQYTIKIGEPRIRVPYELEQKEIESFEAAAELDVSGIAYNKNDMVAVLKAEMQKKKNPGKQLVAIDEEAITYRILRTDDAAGIYELTATIKGIEQFDIRSDQDAGIRLMKKIRDHALGKKIEDAHNFIQNLPEINSVQIKVWPFWAPTIPTVSENVKIVVNDLPEEL